MSRGFESSAEWFRYIESMVPNWGPAKLTAALDELKKESIAGKFPDERETKKSENVRLSLRRRIQRRLEEIKDASRLVPAPNPIVRTEIFSRSVENNPGELFPTAEPIKYTGLDGSTQYIPAQDLIDGFNTALASRPAGIINDALFRYFDSYDPKSRELQLETDSDGYSRYVLKTTFSAFCKMGKIEGKDRTAVRKALENDLLGVLEFVRGNEQQGTREYVKLKYITWREMVTTERPRNVRSSNLTGKKTTRFTLEINAELFGCLLKARGSEGTVPIPLYLTKKIDDSFARIRLLQQDIESKNPTPDQLIPHFLRQGLPMPSSTAMEIATGDKRSLDRYRQAILWILWQWQKGKERRKGYMAVKYSDLTKKGVLGFDPHLSRQESDMFNLFWILFDMKDLGSLPDIANLRMAEDGLEFALEP